MRKLIVFNSVSLDGYFTDRNGDMSWAHSIKQDAEWDAFVSGNASSGGELLFGRITYDLMVAYWPTPLAAQRNPTVAEGMNRCPKVVVSRSLTNPTWNNTRVINDLAAGVRKLKEEPGPGLAILGSGTIVSQLAEEGLIDDFQVVVNPIVLGQGRTMFEAVKHRLNLKLINSRTFGNGRAVLTYEPVR